MEHRDTEVAAQHVRPASRSFRGGWLVILAAGLVFLTNSVSPPHLMDDVDAVQAQIARNMLASGDWVTARLDGVAYLEKSPLIYWMMAASYRVLGVHDWAARLPLALAVIALCWLTYRFGRWAFDDETGFYAGLCLATSVGLFLFTRILIPDATVTLTITAAIWASLRLLEPEESSPRLWAVVLGAALGFGLLLKGLIAVLFPILAVGAFMLITRQVFSWSAWKRLHLFTALAVCLVVALPWHILATLRNPPYFSFVMHSGPGEYRGFFWFYFFNEHILRFLNLRYPRDYNTVPRALFWLLNLVWLFPWSAYLIGVTKLQYRPVSRQGRVRLMAVCWIAMVMLFFTFSTTQEYYSMPIYPALALLIGSSLRQGGRLIRVGSYLLSGIALLLFAVLSGILWMVWKVPAKGDISEALTQHPEMYTLSLGHMGDLTLNAFAYLRLPLAFAAIAFLVCALAIYLFRQDTKKVAIGVTAGMILFFQAARIALVRFDSYLGSYPLVQKLLASPPGELIEANSYYSFSSVFFYTNRTALLLNGRNNNLEYGSYAPNAPQIFIEDSQFQGLWQRPDRYYLLTYGSEMPHLEQLVGHERLYVVAKNSDNYLLSNHPVT